VGNTTIISSFHQEIRTGTKTKRGKQNLETSDFFAMERIENNELTSSERRKTNAELTDALRNNRMITYRSAHSPVTEWSLLSAGPIHRLSGVVIDFSSIVIKNGLYYPRIVINIGSASSVSSSNSFLTLGGIYCLGDVISMYTDMTETGSPQFVLSSGSISIGKRKQDRFYFDGKDAIRGVS